MLINIEYPDPGFDSYRAACVKSLFNAQNGGFALRAELPIDKADWQIGLVVGPSGSGKSLLGRRLFGEPAFFQRHDWPTDAPIIDAIASGAPMDKAPAALAAVGLGSVPSWLRPYHCLSTGERFRADLAKIIAEPPARLVIDEFTSVVDRQVARVGAYAFARVWRKTKGQVVLLSCHNDIARWLEPDWVFDTGTGEFSRRRLRRPKIALDLFETNWRYWPYFEPHHYLKLPHMIAARCYVGFVGESLVAHVGVATRPGLVEARAVLWSIRKF